MQDMNDRRIIITGAGEGLGLAMAKAFLARGAAVTVIARNAAHLEDVWEIGATATVGDATDAGLMDRVVADVQPHILVLNAGARLPMLAIDRQSWDDFSVAWNTDVKAGLVGVHAALNTPMKSGSRVLMMSSGAATVMSSPYIEPESLWLSGGYVGAKRMLWYMAHQANAVSRQRELGVHFQALLPGQLMPGTALGLAVASAYGAIEGVSPEEHVLNRYGSILEPDTFGRMVSDFSGDPRYSDGVAYVFRADAGIVPLDVAAAGQRA